MTATMLRQWLANPNRGERLSLAAKDVEDIADALEATRPTTVVTDEVVEPIQMMLFCPKCGLQHIDAPDERTPDWTNPPHKSHLCHGCGTIWRPADVPTEGVAAIQSRGSKDTIFYNRAALASMPTVVTGEQPLQSAGDYALPCSASSPVSRSRPKAAAAIARKEEMEFHGLDTSERVCFYEQDFYVLSNFSAFNLYWKEMTFHTLEAAYHWEKFASGTTKAERQAAAAVWCAPSAHEAFKIAQQRKTLRRVDWDDVKLDVMRALLRAKVVQHEYVRRKLLATGDRELVENSWRDDYWGWGPNRDGQNMLGKLWMEVRAELASVDGRRMAETENTGSVPQGTTSAVANGETPTPSPAQPGDA